MSITFLDPQFPQKLPSLNEVLDFTVVDTDPDQLTLSLRYSSGHMETIFQQGLVGKLYTVTRDGAENRTFHVRRTGGWPAGRFDLPITEAASSQAQPLSAIYEVDFTALASQTITNPGAVTIDGLTWYAKGALTGQPNGQTQTNALVNGSGLGIASTNAGAATTFFTGAVAYPYRHLFLPMSSVPGYNPLAALMIRWRSTDVGGANGMGFVAGLVSSTNDGTALAGADRQYDDLIDGYKNSSATPHNNPGFKRGLGATASATNTQGSLNLNGSVDAREFGIYRMFADTTMEVAGAAGAWAGTFGALSSLLCNQAALAPCGLSSTRPNPGFFFAIAGQLNATPVYLTHLQIMQPA